MIAFIGTVASCVLAACVAVAALCGVAVVVVLIERAL